MFWGIGELREKMSCLNGLKISERIIYKAFCGISKKDEEIFQ